MWGQHYGPGTDPQCFLQLPALLCRVLSDPRHLQQLVCLKTYHRNSALITPVFTECAWLCACMVTWMFCVCKCITCVWLCVHGKVRNLCVVVYVHICMYVSVCMWACLTHRASYSVWVCNCMLSSPQPLHCELLYSSVDIFSIFFMRIINDHSFIY